MVKRGLIIAVFVLGTAGGNAQERKQEQGDRIFEQPYATRAETGQYIEQLVAEHGFTAEELTPLLGQAYLRTDIIEKISRPAERVWTWGRYKRHLVGEKRIRQGVEFWAAHADTLKRAEQVYGVPPEYVVAILGIETYYGRVTGSYPVLDALMTLGFDYPPRSDFFRRELTQFLLLAREEGKDPASLMGSYAGAMGYGQFISSSYRHYAVDFNDDGVRDIWSDPVDAIGSIANYFARHRWQGSLPVAVQLQPDAQQRAVLDKLASKNPRLAHSIGTLRQQGVAVDESLADSVKVAVFRMQLSVEAEEPGPVEYWLGLPDFYVVTRYNHSHLYALAVKHIADAVKRRFQEEHTAT